MGTRSRIAIIKKDGSIRSIYCHWDGYLEHNGVILLNYYDTEEKVNKLIDLGALSSLERTLDGTVSYHKWRGEELRVEEFKNIAEFFDYMYYSWEEYAYIFKDNEWYVSIDDLEDYDCYHTRLLKKELSEKGMI